MHSEVPDQPVELIEDPETGDRFLIYTTDRGIEVELRFDGEEPWATQKQLADIFAVTQAQISRHLKKILADGELVSERIYTESVYMSPHGRSYTVRFCSLDAILAVGYRVSSKQGILFRRWASDKLRQYLVKGFVVDDERLKNPDGRPDFFDDLLARVRDIRSSEKRMWTRVLELASFCADFHGMTQKDKEHFFATIQNAMHWAVTQETAAEVIHHRVDSSKQHAGVVHFKRDEPTVDEAKVAKNYYSEGEIRALNVLTSATLEFFESQAEQRRPTTIAQFLGKMREFIKLDGRPLIPQGHLGNIAMPTAKEKATNEIAAYKHRLRLEKEAVGENAVGELLDKARALKAEKRAKRMKD